MGAFLSRLFFSTVTEEYEPPSYVSMPETVSSLNQSCIFTKNGNKRGLLIGINYFNTKNRLNGCINDVRNLKRFLIKELYFNSDDIVTLHDRFHVDSNYYPTRNNIQQEINELVSWGNQNKHSEIWLSYSGHGYYVKDWNNDEKDGKDELICTVDEHFIRDDWFKTNLINKLNDDVKLFILMDCCHSGTICDIQHENPENMKKNIVMISGCRDNQTSADAAFTVREEYEWRGALTHTFMNTYDSNHNINEHCETIQKSIQSRFTQIPTLSYTGSEKSFMNICLKEI